MEFKSLRNIETSFRQIRLFGIVVVAVCMVIVVATLWLSFDFAEKQRQKIYVLDGGKSLMQAELAKAQNLNDEACATINLYYTLGGGCE